MSTTTSKQEQNVKPQKEEQQPLQRKTPISNFIMKICTQERFIELKRQMLCDKSDFEPYVAFQRLTRSMNTGITASNIQRFLSENLIDLSLDRCRTLVNHYDADKDGMLSYKEFLEIVLPKEHPDLRAFVTQRECFDISEEEYLSYDTEVALAVLLEREVSIFEEGYFEKEELDEQNLNGFKVVEIIDGSLGGKDGNVNFNNLQRYLLECGLMPYDSEIISFLRRVDRDDDGVVLPEELSLFLEKFNHSEGALKSIRRRTINPTNMDRLRTFSPGRPIVENRISLIAEREKEEKKEEKRRESKKFEVEGKENKEVIKTAEKKNEGKEMTQREVLKSQGKETAASVLKRVEESNLNRGDTRNHYVRSRGNPPKATVHVNSVEKEKDKRKGDDDSTEIVKGKIL